MPSFHYLDFLYYFQFVAVTNATYSVCNFKLLEYQISVFRQAHKHDDDSVVPPLSSKLTTLIKLTLMVTLLSGVLYCDFHIYPLLTMKLSLPSSN